MKPSFDVVVRASIPAPDDPDCFADRAAIAARITFRIISEADSLKIIKAPPPADPQADWFQLVEIVERAEQETTSERDTPDALPGGPATSSPAILAGGRRWPGGGPAVELVGRHGPLVVMGERVPVRLTPGRIAVTTTLLEAGPNGLGYYELPEKSGMVSARKIVGEMRSEHRLVRVAFATPGAKRGGNFRIRLTNEVTELYRCALNRPHDGG